MTENSFNGCFKAAAAHLGFGTMSRKQSNKPVRANRRALAVRTLSSYPELRRLGIGPAKGVRTVVIERSGAVAQGSAAQNGHAMCPQYALLFIERRGAPDRGVLSKA